MAGSEKSKVKGKKAKVCSEMADKKSQPKANPIQVGKDTGQIHTMLK